MSASLNRRSTHTVGSGDDDGRNGEQKKNLWTSMLESVASGKRLPEKNLLVLGTDRRAPGLIGAKLSFFLRLFRETCSQMGF